MADLDYVICFLKDENTSKKRKLVRACERKGLLWIHHNHLVKTGKEKRSSRQRTVKTADEATEINHTGGSTMNTYR